MWGKLWLGVRAVAMTVLFPGTIVGLIPSRVVDLGEILNPRSVAQWLACLVILIGMMILFGCVWEFAHRGRGTLAPFDEPRGLVVHGLYKYVRNPMYVGVLTILLGEAWFFASSRLLVYAGLFFLLTHLVIIAFEEPRLRSKFGSEYERYCTRVGRWLPLRRIP